MLSQRQLEHTAINTIFVPEQNIGDFGRLNTSPEIFKPVDIRMASYVMTIIIRLLEKMEVASEDYSSHEIMLEPTLRKIGWQPRDILALGITLQQFAVMLAENISISADFILQVAYDLINALWRKDRMAQAGIALCKYSTQGELSNTTDNSSNKILSTLNKKFLKSHHISKQVQYYVEYNHIEELTKLISSSFLNLDHNELTTIDHEVQFHHQGMGLIFLAAANGHSEIIELLWHAGLCNINLRCPIELDQFTQTPLSDISALEIAVKKGHVEVVKGLMIKPVINYDLNQLKSLLQNQQHKVELLNYFNGISVITACALAFKSLRKLKFQLQREYAQNNFTTLNALAMLKNQHTNVFHHQTTETVSEATIHFIEALIAIFKAEHKVIAKQEVNTSSFINWVLHIFNHVTADFLELKQLVCDSLKFIGLSIDAILMNGLGSALVSLLITGAGYLANSLSNYFFNTNVKLYKAALNKIDDQLLYLTDKFNTFKIQARPIPYKIAKLIESANQSCRVLETMRR